MPDYSDDVFDSDNEEDDFLGDVFAREDDIDEDEAL